MKLLFSFINFVYINILLLNPKIYKAAKKSLSKINTIHCKNGELIKVNNLYIADDGYLYTKQSESIYRSFLNIYL
jgi:hypothetical protein